jgi:hypothetical protein
MLACEGPCAPNIGSSRRTGGSYDKKARRRISAPAPSLLHSHIGEWGTFTPPRGSAGPIALLSLRARLTMGNSSAAMEKFRDTVDSLTSVDVSASDTAFWEDLWGGAAGGGAASPQQVFEMVGPQEVRKMREERPGNVEALISQAVYRLCSVLDVPTSEGRAAKVEQQALMVVRVLTRVMPFLLEAYYDPVTDSVDPFLHALFWEVKGEHQQQEDKQPLGNVLVSAIMQLLFHPNICVSPKARPGPKERSGPGSDPEDAASSIKLTKMGYCWVGGLQVVKGLKLPNSRQLERNRAEVLRLLLALLCEPLFVAGDEHSRAPLRFAACVTAASAPFASELFTSLMGVVCSFDPIGWGMPFGASVSSEDPTKLFELSVQVLAVLLDQGRAPLPMILEGAGGGGEDSSSPGTTRVEAPRPGEAGYNIFRDLVLRRITTEADFEFVSKGLTRLLNNVWESQATYIPGSSMTAPCHQELLVISWKLLEENPAFTAFMLRAPQYHVNKVLVPLCYFLTENRKDTSKSGLVHICTFILLKLSGERNFGVALNEPFSAHLPTDLPLFKGTHADLLLVVLHKLVVSGSHRLQGLYHCFLTIICNISPYCKNLSLVASMKLLNLLELFTAPGFLFSSPSNYTFVALLLESFNNLIQVSCSTHCATTPVLWRIDPTPHYFHRN